MQEINSPSGDSDYRSRRGREPYTPNTLNHVEEAGMVAMVKRCFNKYADFSGRARRSEYWYFYLFNILIAIPLYFVILMLASQENDLVIIPGILFLIFAIATFIPTLAAVVRRLHDTGRSGWTYFIGLIPFVGGIILLIYLVEDSKPGINKWGPNPKDIGNNVNNNLEHNAFGSSQRNL